MSENKSRRFISLISVIALLGSFLIVIFFLVPKLGDLKALAEEIKATETRFEKGKEKVSALKRAAMVIKSARLEMERLNLAIPTSEKAEEAVAQIAAAANQAGLQVRSVSSGSSGEDRTVLTVTFEGGFGPTLAFIGNIEKNLRPTRIIDFSFVSSSQNDSISSTFNLSFPYIEREETIASSTAGSGDNEEMEAEDETPR